MCHRHDQEQRRHTPEMPEVGAPCGAAEGGGHLPARVPTAGLWGTRTLCPLRVRQEKQVWSSVPGGVGGETRARGPQLWMPPSQGLTKGAAGG